MILLALFSQSAFGDIPDNVLSADSYRYREIEHPGNDHPVEVSFSESDSITSCLGYTIHSDRTDFWLLEIDYSGTAVNWQTLSSQNDYCTDEIDEVLHELDNGNSLSATGQYQNEQFTGLTILLNPQGNELWRRNDWYNDHTAFSSAIQTPDDNFLLAGWTGEETAPGIVETNILLAVLSSGGDQIVGTELVANGNQRACCVSVTNSKQVIVVGSVIQPGENDADIFFWKIDFNKLL